MEEANSNNKYEFDCPQFVDFLAPMDLDDDADAWFEQREEEYVADSENMAMEQADTIKLFRTDTGNEPIKKEETVLHVDAVTKSTGKEMRKADEQSLVVVAERREEGRAVGSSNIKTEQTDNTTEPFSADTVQRPIKKEETVPDAVTKCADDEQALVVAEKKSAQRKKRISSPVKSLRKSKRSGTPANCPTHHTAKKVPNRRSHIGQINKGSSHIKSSEEIEQEKIVAGRKILEESRQQSQASLEMVRASRNYTPKRSEQPPTKPTEFKFQTNTRLKEADVLGQAENLKKPKLVHPCYFSMILRSSSPCPVAKATRSKKPLIKASLLSGTISRKRKNEFTAPIPKSLKTVALQIKEFQDKTPDRFHSKPIQQQNKGPCPIKAKKVSLTIPQSPALMSKSRHRPVTIMSAAEKEEQEYQEMMTYKFKANPVNNKILKGSGENSSLDPSGVTKEDDEVIENYEFHARPVPSKMLEGITGVGKRKHLPITCPKSPAFALKNRVRPKEPEPAKEKEPCPKAKPIPHVGVPFKPNLHHKTTEPQPFSFETRDKNTLVKKETKMQALYIQEQEARKFHAQPLPDQKEQIGIPVRKAKAVTKQEPFHLESENTGAILAEKWAERVQKELTEQKRRASSFRAKPATILYQDPFVPQKPDKPLTDISEFELNTDRRAVEREQFERRKCEKEREKLEVLERQRLLEEEEERRAIARLRAETVHEAQPVRQFKTVKILRSDKPLTVAESPCFTDRHRSRLDA